MKAGTAYVEVKYDPDSVRKLSATAKAEGERIAKSWDGADDGLLDFDRAAKKVNKTMSGGPFNLFDTIGNVGYALLRMGGFAQDGEKALGDMFTTASDGEGIMAGLGKTLTSLAPIAGVAATGFVALGGALLVLPALAAAATFVLVALLDTVTILSAVVVAFLGPLSVLGALLGGLGAAFVLSGQRALKGGGIFKDFAKQVEGVTSKFHDLIYTLGGRFLPLFSQLASAASQALTYLGKIAKLPLKQAFESLGTTGIAMLNKFVYGVANVLKKPFKLAIQIAFGAGGGNANSAIAAWWDSLTKYLFGYTKSKPVHIGSQIVFKQKQITGALQPILDFFNKQHFVDTGLRWAREIIAGLIRLWHDDKGLRDAVRAIFKDAGHQAGKAFKAAFAAEVTNIPWKQLGWWLVKKLDLSRAVASNAKDAFNLIKPIAGAAFDWVKQKGTSIWHAITSAASNAASAAGNAIKSAIGGAFDWVRRKVASVWTFITGLFSHPLSLHVNFPSIPSSLKSLLPHTGGLVTTHGLALAGGGIATGGVIGRDSIPALLTPGELVLNKQQQLALLHGGAQGGDVYVSVKIGERDVENAVVTVQNRTARKVKAGRKWSP